MFSEGTCWACEGGTELIGHPGGQSFDWDNSPYAIFCSVKCLERWNRENV